MRLGEKIQTLRKQKGMSQEQLASKITVSRQAVSKWELNETIPDIENLIQLSKILESSLDYLLDDTVKVVSDIPIIKQERQELSKSKVFYLLGFLIVIGVLLIIGKKTNSIMNALVILLFVSFLFAVIAFLKYIKKESKQPT